MSDGMLVSIERLRQWLDYNPETGDFIWKECLSNVAPIGSYAGCQNARGYHCIQIKGRLYRANRLAWFYVHGVWPSGQVDHINGIPSDDRIANLRVATCSQNQANAARRKDNKSGHKGVSFNSNIAKWGASIQHQGKRIYLGSFLTPEDAASAYWAEAQKLHGEFSRAG